MYRRPKFPKRGEYDHWYNDEPFTDIHEVLQLLNTRSPLINEEFHLHPCPEYDWKWEIVEPWFTSGDSGGDRSGYHYYQIAPELAERLVAECLVTPRKQKEWGYTREILDELVISAAGKTMVETFEAEMRARAESMLTPGVHTDLTGDPVYRGFRREGYRHGRLYYKFQLPESNDCCRVYPEEGRIVLPGAEEEAA